MLSANKRATVSAAGYLFAILVGALVLYVLVQIQFPVDGASNQTPSGTLDSAVLAKIGWQAQSTHVIIAMRTECIYCERSVPFYRKLIDAYHDNDAVRFTAIFPNDAGVVAAYLRVHQLTVPNVSSQPLAAIKVLATPTLLILDSQGRILKAWVGMLSPEGETEVSAALAHLAIRNKKGGER